jgi:putative redox protein
MQTKTVWKEKMAFESHVGSHLLALDAKPPIGQGTGPTPKELLLSAVAGCTGMDVVAYVRKQKQTLTSLEIEAHAETTSGYPAVFQSVQLTFRAVGDCSAEVLNMAIKLSQTQYCGVSAMISKVVPIHWKALLNESEVGSGSASFFGV